MRLSTLLLIPLGFISLTTAHPGKSKKLKEPVKPSLPYSNLTNLPMQIIANTIANASHDYIDYGPEHIYCKETTQIFDFCYTYYLNVSGELTGHDWGRGLKAEIKKSCGVFTFTMPRFHWFIPTFNKNWIFEYYANEGKHKEEGTGDAYARFSTCTTRHACVEKAIQGMLGDEEFECEVPRKGMADRTHRSDKYNGDRGGRSYNGDGARKKKHHLGLG